jgi:hypothetical protein
MSITKNTIVAISPIEPITMPAIAKPAPGWRPFVRRI